MSDVAQHVTVQGADEVVGRVGVAAAGGQCPGGRRRVRGGAIRAGSGQRAAGRTEIIT
ncbi:hypothetical protein [Streptomyces canus]|uniref:hypothetical protein n=1 Tax=Streptomyces canus TaxID=58343 RepID=UPI00216AD7D3|nr:hypothetical protein [Streptomyces canus]